MDILALLQPLNRVLAGTTLSQLAIIVQAMLAMTGRVTMLNISRWAGEGGSYRTVQRFYHTAISWAEVSWIFLCYHILWARGEYILAGDEVVVSKAGKTTYGLDRFFASLFQRVIPGLAFFAFSLVSVEERKAYPLGMEQVIRTEAEKATSKAKAEKRKSKKKSNGAVKSGRPKGSKNKNKQEVVLNAELVRIKAQLEAIMRRTESWITLKYLALDGHFGHNAAMQMVRQCGLQLISKLRHDSELYLPYDGPYVGRGPHRKYGDRIHYDNLPEKILQCVSVEKDIETRIYQSVMLHKDFAQPLNVVIIAKTNLRTQAHAHVILFSSDLALPYEQLCNFYALRFQIEFNFRDAKQFWGLEDFMNTSPVAVSNAANLALFMVNLVCLLLKQFHLTDPLFSVLDLKAYYRGRMYVSETLKWLPQKPDDDFIARLFDIVPALGRIHSPESANFLI